MKIYGWDDVGVWRGELQVADAIAADVHDYGALRAAPDDWEEAFTRFGQAKRELLERMAAEGVDEDIVAGVKPLRAEDLR